MDASRLANIIYDLSTKLSDDEEVDKRITDLASSFGSIGPSDIDKYLKEVKNILNASIVNSYSPSNIKILEEINGLQYYGDYAYRYITDILDSNLYNNNAIIEKLQEYLLEKKAFAASINKLNDLFEKFGISPYFSRTDFEIGLIMPSKFTDSKITNITKELNRWDKVIKTLKELNNETPEDTKIDYVNNGSLDFFIFADEHVAMCLAFIVERILKAYSSIAIIKTKKEELRKLGALSASEKKDIEKNEKEIFDQKLDQIGKDLINDFASKKIAEGRLNEVKVAVKGHISYVAKCINNEMIIEITPPELSEPDSSKEADSDAKKEENKRLIEKYKSTEKTIKSIQKAMETVKTIGKTGLEIMKYLSDGEEPKDEEDKDDEDDKGDSK